MGSSTASQGHLARTLTTPRIVFVTIAGAAPMAAMVGSLPLAFAIGAGAATPLVFLLAGLVLLCFAAGYAAMSRRVVNTGGFYTYVARGLGKPPGVGAALVAVVAYNATAAALAGAFGYFANVALQVDFGWNVPWQPLSAAAIVLVALLGYRQIEISSFVLGALLVIEVVILLIFDVSVVAQRGIHSFPATSFSPHTLFAGAVGVGLMLALNSYVGFEVAALYGEESRNPKRAVPLGTYFSVGFLTVFFVLTSWITVGGIGAGNLQQTAAKQLGNLFFAVNTQYTSTTLTNVMTVLLCTSLFASVLALHNAASRYMFALGRESLMPRFLGVAHPRLGAPSRASATQITFDVIIVGAFALAGADPYTNLATTLLGLGTLGIVALQAAAAFAAVGYFWKRPDRRWWTTVLAPGIGGAGLIAAAVLIVHNYSILTGSHDTLVNSLPYLLAIAAVGGIGWAVWLRSNRAEVYAGLAVSHEREPEDVGSPPVSRVEAVPETAPDAITTS